MKRLCVSLCLLCFTAVSFAVHPWNLEKGDPDLKSAGPLTFGPDGILLVGDTAAATVFAIATGDNKGNPAKAKVNQSGIDAKLAKAFGAESVTINDVAVNPLSGNVYISCAADGKAAIARLDSKGGINVVSLKGVEHSKIELPNPPTGKDRRGRSLIDSSITDMAFVDGKVLISGMSASKSPSTVHEVAFPFLEADPGASLEIYHAAHGKSEDYSAIRTFVPMTIGGEPSLLAGFVCTPLVRVPLKEWKSGKKITGTTIAELGNRNRPYDMIVYDKEGKTFLLMANSARGVMKISTENIDRKEGITERVSGGGVAGQTYETIKHLENVVQLDKLNDDHAVILVKVGEAHHLQTVPLP